MNIIRYLNGGMIGMCFEYAYRANSDVWYIPLSIGILLSIGAIIDLTENKKQNKK